MNILLIMEFVINVLIIVKFVIILVHADNAYPLILYKTIFAKNAYQIVTLAIIIILVRNALLCSIII